MKTPITWISKEASVSAIAPTPGNYKIKTDLSKARFMASINAFGRAGTVVCNYAGKFGDITKLVLIDGNSRLDQAKDAKEKKIWVSLPSRLLTASEFKEMSAIFDMAKAGDVDMDRINKELGTTKSFFEKYSLDVPMEKLASMGASAIKKEIPEEKAPIVSDEYPVTLYFNKKEETEFQKHMERLKVKFKTVSNTETILKGLKKL